MRTCAAIGLAAAALLAAQFNLRTIAQAPTVGAARNGNQDDKDAIAKRAEAFVEAFHAGDAKAVAAFWAADGDYTDLSGRKLAGREAIEKSFTEFFAENRGAKLRIESDSLRFVTPDVAIEDGVSSVLPADGAPPSRAKYTVVHVKKEGQWLLGSVRESAYTPPGNYEHLRGLEGLIGSWAGEADSGQTARVSFAWTENQNFITSTFETSFKNVAVGGGTQWIGWDPATKSVRSWSFQTNGGFGEGAWSREGKTWTLKISAILPDGKKASATEAVTLIDADTVSFRATNRVHDGKPLPDIKEMTLKRVK
jgi:uncharacterized protein (TIGR02246 family)